MYTINTDGMPHKMLSELYCFLDDRMAAQKVEPGPLIYLYEAADYEAAYGWIEGWRAHEEWALTDAGEATLHDMKWAS